MNMSDLIIGITLSIITPTIPETNNCMYPYYDGLYKNNKGMICQWEEVDFKYTDINVYTYESCYWSNEEKKIVCKIKNVDVWGLRGIDNKLIKRRIRREIKCMNGM